MHATEHSDRFTVVLPNGQSMDVFKADLRPETAAELRSMVVPGMATKGDVTEAELDLLESSVEELESARAAQDEIAALSEQAGPPAPSEPMGPPAPAPIVPRGPRSLGRDLVVADAAAAAPAAMFAEQEIPVTGVAPLLDVNAADYPAKPTVPAMAAQQFPGPGAGVPAEFGRVNPIPSFGDAVSAVFGGDDETATAEPVVAPAAPAAALPAPVVDPDAEWKAKFGAFMRESSSQRVPQIGGGVGKQTMEPFAAPKGYLDAVAEQQRVNNDLASFDQRAAADRIALEEAQAIERQRVIDDLAMQRANEQRRLDQMREEAFNGKIDVNRAFDRMDNGQRALSLIGLVLGGIGAGNTGVNAAVGVMERMIDRDIDAQAKDLGRKQTAYSEAIRQGYQAEQARQMAKAEAFSLLDGAIARAAMKSNSERGILNAQAINAELGVKRETTLASLQDAHEGRQLQRMGLDQQRQIANMQMRQAAENAALQRKATLLAAMNKAGALDHTLPNGQVVVASDATAKAKLAEAQRAHVNFVNGLSKIENFRKQSGKAWMPEWAAVFGFDEAEQAQAAQSLAGAVQLAFLKAQGAGAYDKGSGELANKVIPNPGNITTPDDSLFAKTANLRDMANADFLSTVTANTRGGRVYGWTGGEPIGAD